jgi:hypothetical protein
MKVRKVQQVTTIGSHFKFSTFVLRRITLSNPVFHRTTKIEHSCTIVIQQGQISSISVVLWVGLLTLWVTIVNPTCIQQVNPTWIINAI